MYCWPETLAKRGSDEVVSCLHHFLSRVPASVTTLFLYSDGCPGQNDVMHYLHSLVSTGKSQFKGTVSYQTIMTFEEQK